MMGRIPGPDSAHLSRTGGNNFLKDLPSPKPPPSCPLFLAYVSPPVSPLHLAMAQNISP